MEIEFYGGNCFRVKTKSTSLVFDDNLDAVGGKSIVKDTEAVFYTHKSLVSDKAAAKSRLMIDSAGEFEVGDVSLKALQTRAHMDEEGQMTATVYQCMFGGRTVTILGHVHPDLDGDVSEMIGGTDVLVVPVGGNGYTLDAVGATGVIKKVEPDVVIPAHYDTEGLSFEVLAAPLDEFVKASGLQQAEPADSYKVDKPDAELSSQTHLVILNKK